MNLGVVFDPVLNMCGQISSVVKCVHFHLRNLSRIRSFIDQDTSKLALVFSRIEYGSALLLRATDFDLTRLQRLQHRAARLIFLVGRDTSSAPLLRRRLYWLPNRKRINTSVTKGGVPRDPRFVFRAFYYFRLRFFHRDFFLIVLLSDTHLLTQKN